jgi:hypothetical protein
MLAIAIATVSVLAGQAAAAPGFKIPPRPEPVAPKLDSQLAQIAGRQRAQGTTAAVDAARNAAVKVTGDSVTVVVRPAATLDATADAVRQAGGSVFTVAAGLIEASVPIGSLERLSSSPTVASVRPPSRPILDAVTSEGLAALNGPAWHTAGIDGTGVKIAVIDGGFLNYTGAQMAGELPASVTTINHCADFQGTDHGTAVAEIVHDVAPGAQLYLICVEDEVGLAQAELDAKAAGVKIINSSMSFVNDDRGDGRGPAGTPEGTAAQARGHGILWVNSAGNFATQHWSGTFVDRDGDNVLDFSGTDPYNRFTADANNQVCAYLKWDSWPTTRNDYDLFVVRLDTGDFWQSINDQSSSPQAPTEGLCFTVPATGTYGVVISRFNSPQSPRLDLFISGGTSGLQYPTAAGSVGDPADSAAVLAVGAYCRDSDAIEPYSSRGPNIGGDIRPDIAALDWVSTSTYGPGACLSTGFGGTSASAPHAAGAAALLSQRFPSLGPGALIDELSREAIDAGSPGKDNSFGAGRLFLKASGAATLAPSTVAFGSLTNGSTSAPVTVTLSNQGIAPLTVASVAIGGNNKFAFSTSADTCTGVAVPIGGSCTVDVRFIPTTLGAKTANLVFTHNGIGSTSVALSGTGVPPGGVAALSPSSIAFGSIANGTVSSPTTVTLTNNGTDPLTVSSVAIGGNNRFAFSTSADTCTGVAVPIGGSCTVDAKFVPTTLGAKTATVVFTHNGSGNTSVALSGTAVPPGGVAALSPSSIAFGSIPNNTQSAPTTVTLTNNGTGPLMVSSVALGGDNRFAFAVSNNTCTAPVPVGGTCTVDVRFTPTTLGAKVASVVFSHNGSGATSVALSGTSAASSGVAALSPSSIAFGSIPDNTQSAPTTVTLTNNGTGPLTVSSVAFGGENKFAFSLSNNTCTGATVPAGGTCTVDVRFTPTTLGSKVASVVFSHNGGGNTSVALSGTST